jgi:uncharacterized protein (DUF2164 family)
MTKVKRNWDVISEEVRKRSIKDFIDFYKMERNEDIGMMAAENILDHFLQTVGLEIYNTGVKDSISLLKERIEDLEIEMEILIKK